MKMSLFDMYIVRKPVHPTLEQSQLHWTGESWVEVTFGEVALRHGLEVQTVQVFSPTQGKLVPWVPGMVGEPIFFENQSYEFVLEKKEPVEISFHHHPLLRQAVKLLREDDFVWAF